MSAVTIPRLTTVALALLCALHGSPSHAQRGALGPFAMLAGSWSGTGSITLASGVTERLRCQASYNVTPDGLQLQQSLRCASDSYQFDVRASIQYQGGALSGRWTDVTRNASGSLSGRASGNQVQAVVRGPGFAAGLGLATRGDRQSVTITSQGTELTRVSIVLRRMSA